MFMVNQVHQVLCISKQEETQDRTPKNNSKCSLKFEKTLPSRHYPHPIGK